LEINEKATRAFSKRKLSLNIDSKSGNNKKKITDYIK